MSKQYQLICWLLCYR